jgi:hypothetical protein
MLLSDIDSWNVGALQSIAFEAAPLLVTGCDRPARESPIINEDVPVMDIAQLRDIEQPTAEMLNLIKRVRTEATQLVPAAEPWEWSGDQQGFGCDRREPAVPGSPDICEAWCQSTRSRTLSGSSCSLPCANW